MGLTYIYGLWDPRDGRLRYIGKSNDPKSRLPAHLRAARKKGATSHLRCWLIGLMNDDERPMLEILEEVPISDWQECERDWIKQCRDLGLDLVNSCPGGLGGGIPASKLSEETIRKRSEAMKLKWQDPEHRKKVAEAKKKSGKPQGWAAMSLEQRQAFRDKRKTWSPRLGQKNTAEHNAKIGAANAVALKGVAPAKEVTDKGLEARWSDLDAKVRQAEAMEKYRGPDGRFLPKEAAE